MGELYLDQIDRILLRQYEESRSVNCPEVVQEVVDHLKVSQGAQAPRRQIEPTPDDRFLSSCKS